MGQSWADLDLVGHSKEKGLGLSPVGRDRQDGVKLD